MRIYSMTATFGKLEHETLTLKPGLNIIEAPNEWGKSTWCAFLLAMLYGLDTRAKTTKSTLADKERYAPWSGSPMSGRIDLNWQGRDITIERKTGRRIPLGEFRAYETKTGLPVPELTAANCGQQLLGVEQTVFRRAGFIRFSDLPVTQDEALRRRLNALVTTGDESGAADRLSKDLKELKNRIRYNRSGLLPQAESQLEEVEGKLQELEHLTQQSRKLRQRLDEQKQWQLQLENHRKALQYTASQLDARRIAAARDAREAGLQRLTELEHTVADLPAPETVQRNAQALEAGIARERELQMELHMLSQPPVPPTEAAPFRGLSGEQAVQQVQNDTSAYGQCKKKLLPVPWLVGLVLSLAAAIAVYFLTAPFWLPIPGGLALLCITMALLQRNRQQRRLHHFVHRYGSPDPGDWLASAREHGAALEAYQKALRTDRNSRSELEQQLKDLRKQLDSLCRRKSPDYVLALWKQALRHWDAYHKAQEDQTRLERHLHDLQAMARTAPAPDIPDPLDYSEDQTDILLNDSLLELQRLENRLNQYRGRMEALGELAELTRKHTEIRDRITQLEETYAALTIAQETLLEARQELQRRFAPRIAKRAQVLLGQLTQGRYQRLTLGNDFQLQAAAESEDTLQDAWWRSDGTVDQLYLALRLAVAGELTPDVPLILDDALVRFDDRRAKAALDILQQEAESRQVLLFTCQSRESALLSNQ